MWISCRISCKRLLDILWKGEKGEWEGNVNICHSLTLSHFYLSLPPTTHSPTNPPRHTFTHGERVRYLRLPTLCLSLSTLFNSLITSAKCWRLYLRIFVLQGYQYQQGDWYRYWWDGYCKNIDINIPTTVACVFLCLHHLNRMLTLVTGKPINIAVSLDGAGHSLHDRWCFGHRSKEGQIGERWHLPTIAIFIMLSGKFNQKYV